MIKHEEKRKKFQLKLQIEGGVFGRGKQFQDPPPFTMTPPSPKSAKLGASGCFCDCFWQICVLHPLLCQHCNSPIFQQCCLRASLHSAIFSVLPTHPMPKHSSCNSLPHPSLPSATPPVTQVSSAFSHVFYGLSSLPHLPTFISYLQGKSQHVLLSSAAKQLMMTKDASPFPSILVGFYYLHYSGPSFHST